MHGDVRCVWALKGFGKSQIVALVEKYKICHAFLSSFTVYKKRMQRFSGVSGSFPRS